MHTETLRRWVRQKAVTPGPRSHDAEEERIRALEREVRELRKANESFRLTSAFFAQAEPGRHFTP
jgi:transposase